MKDRYPTRGLSTVLDGYLKKAGLDGALVHQAAWSKAAGELMAENVRSLGTKGWTLKLEADSQHWLQTVQTMEAQLIPRLQAAGLEVTRITVALTSEAAKHHKPKKQRR